MSKVGGKFNHPIRIEESVQLQGFTPNRPWCCCKYAQEQIPHPSPIGKSQENPSYYLAFCPRGNQPKDGAETGFPCDSPTDHTDFPGCVIQMIKALLLVKPNQRPDFC